MVGLSILIKNGIIATVNEKNQIIKDGAIYIEEGRIQNLGRTEEVAKKHKADKVIDAHRKIVLPGLIDAHTHMVGCLVRGLGADMPLLNWLEEHQWPFLAGVTEEDAYVGGLLGCIEAIKTGSTCVVENYYSARERKRNIDRVADAIEKSGIRGFLMRGYHDKKFMIPEIFVESEDEVFREYDRIIHEWHGRANDRIMAWVSPVNLLFSTPELIVRLHELAEKHGVGMHTHMSESKRECELIKKEYGKSYAEVFQDLGVLGPKFHGAHSVWLTDKDIKLLAQTNSRTIHNPTSNMYLASGFSPVPKMLKAGVCVALGTDGGNCNNNQDMLEAMKFAALLHKVNALDPTAMSAVKVLRMATINGAKALGLGDEIGSLEIGKKADITIVDLKKPHNMPIHDPISTLVYSSNGGDVDTVIIDGKIIMENREIKTVDEGEVLEKAQEVAENLVQRMVHKTKSS